MRLRHDAFAPRSTYGIADLDRTPTRRVVPNVAELTAWTVNQQRVQGRYFRDRSVEEGWCAVCGVRRKHTGRRCQQCVIDRAHEPT